MEGITLKELREKLAKELGIAPTARGAFEGRIQHFQRLGFPAGTNTGSGHRAIYSPSDVDRLRRALALNIAGVMPSAAISLVDSRGMRVGDYLVTIEATRIPPGQRLPPNHGQR